MEQVGARRRKVQERLRRLGKAYADGIYDDQEYKRQKQALEMELESLVLPQADAAADAGNLIERLPEMRSMANIEERRRILLAMLDAVYVDTKETLFIVALKPKAPFRPIFQLATTRAGSGRDAVPRSGPVTSGTRRAPLRGGLPLAARSPGPSPTPPTYVTPSISYYGSKRAPPCFVATERAKIGGTNGKLERYHQTIKRDVNQVPYV